MRVTIVVSAIDGSGGFRVVATLGQQLIKRGHSVCVFAPRPTKFSFKAKLKARLKGKRLVTEAGHSVHLGTLTGVNVDHPAPLIATDLPDADVVIGTWWQTMQWIDALPIEKGAKLHLVQDYEVWPPNNPAAVDAVLRYKYPKIAISNYLRGILIDDLGNNEVYLLQNAVDHQIFHAPPRAKGQQTTVGFTYSPDIRKGSDLIIKAVTRARSVFPQLNVVAFSHYTPQTSVPVPAWIDFHVDPSQDKIRSLYAKCDAWLFGSRREGFGLPILEAMACRTPVIGMPAGAAPDLLGDGAGVLVADQDWEAMAQAIVDVTAMSDAEWLGLSQRAHRRAEENQWDIIGEKLEHILGDLVSRQQPVP